MSNDDLGVTDDKEKRRNIRRTQRQLSDEIAESRTKLEDVKSGFLSDLLQRNEMVFSKVTHTREQHHDAMILKELTRFAEVQAAQLNDNSFLYDFELFSHDLKTFFQSDGSNGSSIWEDIGRQAGCLFLSVPSMQTLKGPIQKIAKERKISVRHGKDGDLADISKADEIIQSAEDVVSEATNERVKYLVKVLEGVDKKEGLAPVLSLTKTLIDRSNPVQTIENFFDYAFLVKSKRVAEKVVGDRADIVGTLIGRDKLSEINTSDQSSQLILSLGIKELKELASLLELQGTCLLHREDALYTALSAVEQVRRINSL